MLPRSLALVVLLFSSSGALAQEPARYSDRGRNLLGGSLDGSWYSATQQPGESTLPSWTVSLEPSWIHFVRDRIGLGAYVGYEAGKGRFVGQGRYFDQAASAGFTAAFEVWSSGSWGLLLRPAAGLAARFRKYDSGVGEFVPLGPVSDTPVSIDPNLHYEHSRQRDLRGQLQLRASLVYTLSSSVVLGFGPDLLYERIIVHSSRGTSARYDGFRVAATSFIGATF